MRISTELHLDLHGVSSKIPVDIEYQYHRAVPGCGSSLRDPATVEIQAIHWKIGLHEKRDITFLFPDTSGIEQAILEDVKEDAA